MTANAPAAPGLPRKAGKSASLLPWLGLACLMVAPMLYLGFDDVERQNARLQAEGVVAAGTVTAKDTRTYTASSSRGRSRQRKVRIVTVRYDMNATVPYADWAAGKAPVPSAYPAVVTSDLEVPWYHQDAVKIGEAVFVVRILGDLDTETLTRQLEDETSLRWRLLWRGGLLVLGAAGIGLVTVGWLRRRRAMA